MHVFSMRVAAVWALCGGALILAIVSILSLTTPRQTLAVAPLASTEQAVSIAEFQFTPAVITVTLNNSIRWTNHGTFQHTVTEFHNKFDSEAISPGVFFTQTFTQTGVVSYFCEFHPSLMHGFINVVEQVEQRHTYVPLIRR